MRDTIDKAVSAVTMQHRPQNPGEDGPDSSFARQAESDSEGEFNTVAVCEGTLSISSMSKPRSRISGMHLEAGDILMTSAGYQPALV